MIVWITGISGSGKTTISNRVYNKYKDKFSNLVKVDGDVVREIFGRSKTKVLYIFENIFQIRKRYNTKLLVFW